MDTKPDALSKNKCDVESAQTDEELICDTEKEFCGEAGDGSPDQEDSKMICLDEVTDQNNISQNKHNQTPDNITPKYSGLSKRARKRMKRFEQIKAKSSQKDRKIEDRGYSKAIFAETDYYFEDGLRNVYPYYFTFTTHAKERWFKKTLIDVFTKEFLAETPDRYRKHIANGKILVNGKKINEDYELKNGDEIRHTVHRHENPVVSGKFEIIEDTDDILVINKPASIPCHPCGKYRHNSIVFILGKEYGYANLRNIYRLDRLTSGVLILGKTPSKTKQLEDDILKRKVEKEYVCRVTGEFPEGVIKVDQPLACLRHNLTLWKVEAGGKESQTSFEKISYNGHSSVVRCHPHTGRTHQIRVHLQYLGYPIVNDPFYNSDAWGPSRGKGGLIEMEEKDVVAAILKEHNVGQFIEGDNPLYTRKLAELKTSTINEVLAHKEDNDDTGDEPLNKKVKLDDLGESRFNEKKWNIDLDCEECKKKYYNPQPKDLILYLHAHKYKGPDWSYEAPLPEWASEDWIGQTIDS